MDPEIDFAALMGAFDTVLLGGKTYEATRGYSGGGMPGMQAYVFSTTLRQDDCPGVAVSDNRATGSGRGATVWRGTPHSLSVSYRPSPNASAPWWPRG